MVMMNLKQISLFVVWIIILGCGSCKHKNIKTNDSQVVVEKAWTGFKDIFIESNGRVKRVKKSDTVSEGQAYAMLRAVWMNDKVSFDKCYKWTEENLSRVKDKGDNLLGWIWKDGAVIDWMPAADADVDYALSLIFADMLWPDLSPVGVEEYGLKAKAVLSDILEKETFVTSSGKIYLAPWIVDKEEKPEIYPLNPSYFSPAHFRIFHDYTGDDRWAELADTSYYVLNSLIAEFDGQKGVGLIPDWCGVDRLDGFHVLQGKNSGFGYEALRVPFRIGLDSMWFSRVEAKEFLGNFNRFLENQMKINGRIYCEYDYSGQAVRAYESPAFYSCYYFAMKISGSHYVNSISEKIHEYILKTDDGLYYQSKDEYYSNCLSWLADGYESGCIENLFKRGIENAN
jgi:endoglucanase